MMKHDMNEIQSILLDAASLHEKLASCADSIAKAIDVIGEKMKKGGTLFAMGNGGSAADAQHLAGELVGRFEMERPALPCVALTTDTSIITSVGNDYGVADIFTRQVEGLVRSGDVVLGISTSGTSSNIIDALVLAQNHGAATVGLTGAEGGDMSECCDVVVRTPSDQTPRIQEGHSTIIHIMCRILERELSQ
ncbi:MAG: D-sedoheptulose-7-phosphate isomerase [Planctomycetota bacterium]